MVWEAQGCATGRFQKLTTTEDVDESVSKDLRFHVKFQGPGGGFHKCHSVLASVCSKHQRQSMMLHTQDGPEAANTTMADLEVWEDKLNKIFQLEALEKSATPLLWKKTWEKISFTYRFQSTKPILEVKQRVSGAPSKLHDILFWAESHLPEAVEVTDPSDLAMRDSVKKSGVPSRSKVWSTPEKRWGGAFWLHGLQFQQILEGLTGVCGQLVNARGGEKKIKYSVWFHSFYAVVTSHVNQSSAVQVFTHPTSVSRHVPRAWMRREGG